MFSRKNWQGISFFTILVFAYLGMYFSYHATPSIQEGQFLGWWKWGDQGLYLRSTKAFAEFDFSSGSHSYPPLYSLLGAIFYNISSQHPYLLINLASFFWFAYVFIAFSSQYTSRLIAGLLFFVTVVANYTIFLQFVIPWTTTLVAAIFSTGIFGLLKQKQVEVGQGKQLGTAQLVGLSLILGLTALTRPVDTIIAGVLWLGLILRIYSLKRKASANKLNLQDFTNYILPTFFLFFGSILFLMYNKIFHGGFLSSYFKASSAVGISLPDFFEKFTSIILDSEALYLIQNQAIVDHYPWILISILAAFYFMVVGDWALRTLLASIFVCLVLYIPYNDLFPNGIWKYHNIHYFKWLFPYLGLFAWVFCVKIIQGFKIDKRAAILKLLFFMCLGSLILSVKIKLDFNENDFKHQLFEGEVKKNLFSFNSPTEIDFIDIFGIQGAYHSLYLGNHRVFIDGETKYKLKDFKIIPGSWGVRLLFTRPIIGSTVSVELDKRARYRSLLKSRVGTYSFSVGIPSKVKMLFSGKKIPPKFPSLPLIVLPRSETKLVQFVGFSKPEKWGRWSIGKKAKIVFGGPIPQKFNVSIYGFSFGLNEKYPFQIKCGQNTTTIYIKNTREMINFPCKFSNEERWIEFVIPKPISPKDLKMGKDTRRLGLGIVNIQLQPIN